MSTRLHPCLPLNLHPKGVYSSWGMAQHPCIPGAPAHADLSPVEGGDGTAASSPACGCLCCGCLEAHTTLDTPSAKAGAAALAHILASLQERCLQGEQGNSLAQAQCLCYAPPSPARRPPQVEATVLLESGQARAPMALHLAYELFDEMMRLSFCLSAYALRDEKAAEHSRTLRAYADFCYWWLVYHEQVVQSFISGTIDRVYMYDPKVGMYPQRSSVMWRRWALHTFSWAASKACPEPAVMQHLTVQLERLDSQLRPLQGDLQQQWLEYTESLELPRPQPEEGTYPGFHSWQSQCCSLWKNWVSTCKALRELPELTGSP